MKYVSFFEWVVSIQLTVSKRISFCFEMEQIVELKATQALARG